MAKKYVAITGGIGSGKSAVLEILRGLNYPVFSCDEIYKEVIQSAAYIEKVQALFPGVVKDGCIDRKGLGKVVFNDKERLKELNDLAHPLIMAVLIQCMNESQGEIVFAEVPLLFEGNFENLFNEVLYITRDNDQRIAAIVDRDKISADDAQKRIDSQFDGASIEGKRRLKNCNAKVIDNNKTKEDLKNTILDYLSRS